MNLENITCKGYLALLDFHMCEICAIFALSRYL